MHVTLNHYFLIVIISTAQLLFHIGATREKKEKNIMATLTHTGDKKRRNVCMCVQTICEVGYIRESRSHKISCIEFHIKWNETKRIKPIRIGLFLQLADLRVMIPFSSLSSLFHSIVSLKWNEIVCMTWKKSFFFSFFIFVAIDIDILWFSTRHCACILATYYFTDVIGFSQSKVQ